MKALLEKTSLLALSFMLVSSFAVSPALPQMLTTYGEKGLSYGQVNLLISASSFAIMAMVFLTPWLTKRLTERQMVCGGLLLLSLAGAFPVLVQDYYLVLLSRLFLGLGIGLINAKAINIISQRYQGKERVQMLGLRGSAEVLGSAILTALAGQLLNPDWTKAFLVYLMGLVFLAAYLLFVKPVDQADREAVVVQPLTGSQWRLVIGLAAYAAYVILVNSAITIQLPVFLEETGMASAQTSSLILSVMMVMGILSGALFGPVLHYLKSYLMASVLISLAIGLGVMSLASVLWLVAFGALLTGFVYSIGVTYVFHQVADRLPHHQLTTATSIILVGCNLGGGCAAFVVTSVAMIWPEISGFYQLFTWISLFLGVILLLKAVMVRK